MNQHEAPTTLEAIVEPLITEEGFDLVELRLRGSGRNQVLSILADRPYGGITVDECAMLNEKIRLLLEKEAVLGEDCTLEVSSPGLDRPLVERKDFLRAAGRNLRIFLKEPVDGRLELIGRLIEVGEDKINLETENGAVAAILISNIIKTKQILTER